MKRLVIFLLLVFAASQAVPVWLSVTDRDHVAWIGNEEDQTEEKAKEETKKEIEKYHCPVFFSQVMNPASPAVPAPGNDHIPAFYADPHTPPPDRC